MKLVDISSYDKILSADKIRVPVDNFLLETLNYMEQGKLPVFLCDTELANELCGQAEKMRVAFTGANIYGGNPQWLFANKTRTENQIDFTWMPHSNGTIHSYFNGENRRRKDFVFLIPIKEMIMPMDIGSII